MKTTSPNAASSGRRVVPGYQVPSSSNTNAGRPVIRSPASQPRDHRRQLPWLGRGGRRLCAGLGRRSLHGSVVEELGACEPPDSAGTVSSGRSPARGRCGLRSRSSTSLLDPPPARRDQREQQREHEEVPRRRSSSSWSAGWPPAGHRPPDRWFHRPVRPARRPAPPGAARPPPSSSPSRISRVRRKAYMIGPEEAGQV